MQNDVASHLEFTAGAQRALAEAACWSDPSGRDEWDGPAILLGLLAESECRAAAFLAGHGVTADAVRQRWPHLTRESNPAAEPAAGGTAPTSPRGRRFSDDARASLELATAWLAEHGQPPELATEHILLGLAAADHEVGVWLRQQGLSPGIVDMQIHRAYGLPPDAPTASQADQPTTLPSDEAIPLDAPDEASWWERPIPPAEAAAEGEAIHVLRIIDAAANRAREGLRVVEDYVRFVLDDRHLTAQLKNVRHDLTAALASVAIEHRLAARETQFDVGTDVATAGEMQREGMGHVLTANFTRLQESLRALEEFGKLLDPAMAAAIEQLRYRTYTLHRAVEITRASRQRLAHARLYVLVDGRPSIEEFDALVRDLVLAGVDVLQLRDKRLDDRTLLDRARLLRELTMDSQTLFVMNDRPDLAVLARADGVHVGQEELSVKDVRSLVGPRMLIGVSTHSIQQARAAVLDGADYIGVGPTFPSGTKEFDVFPGLDLVRAVSAEITLPAFAIGGITAENAAEVLAAGATRVAVSGAITQAANSTAAAAELLALLR
jgi:thiamine-phosphate pyrophosphorylase